MYSVFNWNLKRWDIENGLWEEKTLLCPKWLRRTTLYTLFTCTETTPSQKCRGREVDRSKEEQKVRNFHWGAKGNNKTIEIMCVKSAFISGQFGQNIALQFPWKQTQHWFCYPPILMQKCYSHIPESRLFSEAIESLHIFLASFIHFSAIHLIFIEHWLHSTFGKNHQSTAEEE